MPKAWTFITSHGAVLAYLSARQQVTGRQIADDLGLTERTVRRVVRDLERGGYISKTRVGSVNRYDVEATKALRHPGMQDIEVSKLINALQKQYGPLLLAAMPVIIAASQLPD